MKRNHFTSFPMKERLIQLNLFVSELTLLTFGGFNPNNLFHFLSVSESQPISRTSFGVCLLFVILIFRFSAVWHLPIKSVEIALKSNGSPVILLIPLSTSWLVSLFYEKVLFMEISR